MRIISICLILLVCSCNTSVKKTPVMKEKKQVPSLSNVDRVKTVDTVKIMRLEHDSIFDGLFLGMSRRAYKKTKFYKSLENNLYNIGGYQFSVLPKFRNGTLKECRFIKCYQHNVRHEAHPRTFVNPKDTVLFLGVLGVLEKRFGYADRYQANRDNPTKRSPIDSYFIIWNNHKRGHGIVLEHTSSDCVRSVSQNETTFYNILMIEFY